MQIWIYFKGKAMCKLLLFTISTCLDGAMPICAFIAPDYYLNILLVLPRTFKLKIILTATKIYQLTLSGNHFDIPVSGAIK